MDYSFYAEFQKGHTLKSTIDILNSSKIPRCPIHISPGLVEIRISNANNSILYNIRLDHKSMSCKKERYFSVNLKHLARLLKNVKKKDSLTLFFTNENQGNLGIIIQPAKQSDMPRKEQLYITIHEEDLDLCIDSLENADDGEPIYNVKDMIKASIKTTEYQRLKELKKISKNVNVKLDKGYISFMPVGEVVFGGELSFGVSLDKPVYNNEFFIEHFIAITKVSGVSTIMSFIPPVDPDYPLKVLLDIHEYGTMCIYIKTVEQLESDE